MALCLVGGFLGKPKEPTPFVVTPILRLSAHTSFFHRWSSDSDHHLPREVLDAFPHHRPEMSPNFAGAGSERGVLCMAASQQLLVMHPGIQTWHDTMWDFHTSFTRNWPPELGDRCANSQALWGPGSTMHSL